MGYDTSYHPIDVELIEQRIIPFIRGKGDIDDLVERTLTHSKVRFHANAWGLGVLDRAHAEWDHRRAVDKYARARKKKKKPAALTYLVPEGFHSDLHIWGRPFFIVADTAAQVSALVDRYNKTTAKNVDALARKMIEQLNPKLLDVVEKSMEGTLPDDAAFRYAIRWKMDLFRAAYDARLKGKKVKDPGGETHNPKKLFADHLALAVLEFLARLQPGWMDRGVWPTWFFATCGFDPKPFFESPAQWFAPLLREIPEIKRNLPGAIVDNFMVGGYVRPDRVSDLRRFVEDHRAALNAAEDEDCTLSVQKWLEALHDAERRKLGFVEAAEIYSGPMGIMN